MQKRPSLIGNSFARIHGHATRKHGLSPTYRTWAEMLQRCKNPKRKSYPDYGARGIRVCKRWNEFPNFLKDMGIRPDNKTLDRIDNSRGYTKENCRWSTAQEQARNTRRNAMFTVAGKTGCLSELCKMFNLRHGTVRHRLNAGWSVDDSFLHPIRLLRHLRPDKGATIWQPPKSSCLNKQNTWSSRQADSE